MRRPGDPRRNLPGLWSSLCADRSFDNGGEASLWKATWRSQQNRHHSLNQCVALSQQDNGAIEPQGLLTTELRD